MPIVKSLSQQVSRLIRSRLRRIILLLLLSLVISTGLTRASSLKTHNLLDDVKIVSETIVGQPGFFRVGQSTKKRWWFIDPEDKPFLYKGVTSVGDGRGIAPTTSPLSSYTEILTQKYGRDAAKFRQVTFEQLRSWNFNALGAWTASDFWDREMPYTIVLDFVKVESVIQSYGVRVPDVFDPKWPKEIEAKVKKIVAPRHDSKLLLGYFTDNELGWGDLERPDRVLKLDELLTDKTKPSLLQTCLSLAEVRPAYQAAWDFVLKRHGNSLKQLAQDWQVEIKSKAQIEQWTQSKQAIVSPGFVRDNRQFVQKFAQRYFELSAQAIRRYDRHHLLLGCRFGAPPSKALLSVVKRPWVDVVSANNYRYNMYERMDIYYRATHLPILITEFSWGQDVFSRRPLPNEPTDGLATPERMTRNGEQSLARALTHPGIVGYTWYRWVDRPTYKPPYVPPISLGLITLKDEPNRWHTDLLTQLNAKAEAIATTNFGYSQQ